MIARSALAAWLLPLLWGTPPAPVELPRPCGWLRDPALAEVSGMAASRRYRGMTWMHNDSGDAPRLFLVDNAGQTRVRLRLTHATATDWEDMAAAGGHLYIGDIGDNLARRPEVTVYYLPEPAVPVTASPAPALSAPALSAPALSAPALSAPALSAPGMATAQRVTELEANAHAVTLRYPDGPCDAETLLALPDGRVIIVSKHLLGSRLYLTPQPLREGGARQTLRFLGALTFSGSWRARLITAGDLSPDGRRLALASYTELHEWRLPRGWLRAPTPLPQGASRQVALPALRQMEALCYATAGTHLLIASEGLPAPMWQLPSLP